MSEHEGLEPVDSSEGQLPLFDESEMPAGRELLMEPGEAQRRFTADQVAKNRARYMAIVQCIAEGLPLRQICTAFGVSHHTVLAIRERDPELVATEKERVKGEWRRLGAVSRDRLMELLLTDTKLTAAQAGVIAGIVADKLALVEGQPTMTVTVRHEIDQDTVRRAFEELAKPVLDISAVTNTVTMPASDSQSAENPANSPQKGPLALPAVTDVVNLELPDSDADAYTYATGTTGAQETPTPTSTGTTAPDPRGGGARAAEAPTTPMDTTSENLK